MNPPAAEKLQELLSQGRADQAVALLQRLDPDAAADSIIRIPFEEQQIVFRALPVDYAATLVSHFPYYHSYVLLHSRTIQDLRAIIDKTQPQERHQFFDELPEEAWQHLMDELSGERAAAARGEAIGAAIARAPAAVEPIITASQIQKCFVQPDGREIQVIAPIDLSIEPDSIVALAGPFGKRQIHSASDSHRAHPALRRQSPLARRAAQREQPKPRHCVSKFRLVPLAYGIG